MQHVVVKRRIAVALSLAVVAAGVAFVLTLRANGAAPQGQNWWLVCWLTMAAGYGSAGAALIWWPARRPRGDLLPRHRRIGLADRDRGAVPGLRDRQRRVAAVAAAGRSGRLVAPPAGWDLGGGRAVGAAPAHRRHERWIVTLRTVGFVALVGLVVTAVLEGPDLLERICAWVVCIVATAATATLARHWWRNDRASGDLLPAWLLASAVAGWLAVVPDLSDIADWRLPGRDVVTPMLFLATVPLLVAGTVIELVRRSPGSRTVHRVVEWATLAGGIVVVYTALVAGLGQLVGGSGPTWFLVASTGAIAIALEPVRRRIRRLADGLVYGLRDDPLVAVQHVVDRVGSGGGADLLPDLATTLQRELRMDAVAIDVRRDDDWQRVATCGGPTPHTREVLLRHRDEVVGRLVVGWEQGPTLRPQDDAALVQLAGPLTLAVRWVGLSEDLHRSNMATVLAREEERRRLNRDLHDGLGPALTGVSLGLRTAVGRVAARGGPELVPTTALLDRLADEVDATVTDLRRIVRDLRPTALDQLGLMEALTEFVRKYNDDLEIHLVLPEAPVALPAAVEVATYRIVTEAVTNVVRHAGASRCCLSITAGHDRRDRRRRRRRRDGRPGALARHRVAGDARASGRARRVRRRAIDPPARDPPPRRAAGGPIVTGTGPPLRVAIVDDHPMFRMGLAVAIADMVGIELVGEAETADAVPALITATAPDVVLLDVRLGDGSGLEVNRWLHAEHPESRWSC